MPPGDHQHDSLGSNYRLLDKIGEGAMGAVWRAVDRRTGEHVAAKLLHGRLLDDPDIVGRFVQERNVLLRLRHPGIVAIRDFVIEGSRVAIVMDLIEGSDLGRHLRERGTLPPAQAVGIAIELAGALTVAHAAGVVHRDVKPANVLLGRTAMLTDFGVARILQGPAAAATAVVGTPIYMAPEAIEGASAAPAADAYALGMVLYELLAGRAPFAAGNHLTALNCAFNSEPRRLAGMTDDVWSIIKDATAKDPAKRPAVPELAARLQAALPALAAAPPITPVHRDAPLTITAVPVSQAARPVARPRGRGRRAVIAVTSAAAATVLALIAVQLARTGDPTGPVNAAAEQSITPTPKPTRHPLATLTPQVVDAEPTEAPSATTRKPVKTPSAKNPATSNPASTSEPTRKPAAKKPAPTPKPTKPKVEPSGKPSVIQQPPPLPDAIRCRQPWLVVGKTGIAMRPCIRIKDGVLAVVGEVRGNKGVNADASVELWRPGVGTMAGPFVCNGLRFTRDGEIKTCGWFRVDPPDGALYQSRQRWRLTGSGDFNGGAQSTSLRW
ncbi:serine/threonine-protein kinase [Spongiactinospora sp. TRM90649]|uniref:serine/threonine-protein kinase n=1 Tax=Spongiactinospora sp. TRM90649 TaxID=3031114 RepID=UPI0023F87BF9|nr:serine/threonine-protein kinase [Spongiactinospora sp. TRM90649]MDF5758533.1 serine/threonine-protein kinase [Spongiactinospora sp. TRM90649]